MITFFLLLKSNLQRYQMFILATSYSMAYSINVVIRLENTNKHFWIDHYWMTTKLMSSENGITFSWKQEQVLKLLWLVIISFSVLGGHSTEEKFVLCTQKPQVRISTLPKFSSLGHYARRVLLLSEWNELKKFLQFVWPFWG